MQIEINCENTRKTLARVYNTIIPHKGEGIHLDRPGDKQPIHGLVTEINWDFSDIPIVRIYIKQ